MRLLDPSARNQLPRDVSTPRAIPARKISSSISRSVLGELVLCDGWEDVWIVNQCYTIVRVSFHKATTLLTNMPAAGAVQVVTWRGMCWSQAARRMSRRVV